VPGTFLSVLEIWATSEGYFRPRGTPWYAARLGFTHGMGMGRLVGTHVEVVVDVDTAEVTDSSDTCTDKKAKAITAWAVSNNLRTASVYVSRFSPVIVPVRCLRAVKKVESSRVPRGR
jgi:hypothetical protein